MTRALHMRRERRSGEGLDLRFSLCGFAAVSVTDSVVEVTCKLCRERLAAIPAPVVDERIGETRVVERGAHVLDAHAAGVIAKERRGELDDAPRWRTLGAAFRQWHAVVRDGASVRSSSDPDRFGHRAQTSGGAVRTPGGRDDVLDFERGLERACAVPVRDVGRVPTEREQRAALVGRYIEELTFQQIADDLGDGWTRRQVALVLRGLSRAMIEDLAARGVLEAGELRRGARPAREEERMRIPGYDLEGWKEIAAHLGCSEDTAQRRARSAGLPVREVDVSRRVVANRAALDAWMAAQVGAA